jgi:hypothetical protein
MWHTKWNEIFLDTIAAGGEPVNDAESYGVRIVPAADLPPDQLYWRIIGVHHLEPLENWSNHNVYIEVLDEAGLRVQGVWAGWDWEGREDWQRADPVPLDKWESEPAGNITMHGGQVITAWLSDLARVGVRGSDRIENVHARHPDEPLEDGRLFNTIGHHSFYVVFQQTPAPGDEPPPVPEPEPPAPAKWSATLRDVADFLDDLDL